MKREKIILLSNIQQFMDYCEMDIEKMVEIRNKYSEKVKRHCLQHIPAKNEIDGIYFGNEFCDSLLPSCSDIEKVYNYCQENQIKFSLVLPYVTQEKMGRVETIFEYLSEHNMQLEIICNDWGIVYLIHSRYSKQSIVLGRLLDKMYKDARMGEDEYKKIFEENSLRYLKNSNVYSQSNLDFCEEFNITRVELDCPPQGLKLQGNISANNVKVSLYINFGFLTTGRMCMMRFLDAENGNKYSLEKECGRKCQIWDQVMKKNSNAYVCEDGGFFVGNMEFYRKGNTVFYLTAHTEQALEDNPMIDREIYQLCMPM